MSRASAAGFADFFPAAPRSAKDRAKERQRAKSKALDSPSPLPVNPDHDASSTPRSRDETGHIDDQADNINIAAPDASAPPVDDAESLQGDLLNGVGSASSHASTISSVFSNLPSQHTTTMPGTGNPSSLTPLTNLDSSPPPGQSTSPNRSSFSAPRALSRDTHDDKIGIPNGVTHSESTLSESFPSTPQVFAREPGKSVKGEKCIYDPQLDHKLSSSERKKAKPTYKEFGLEDDAPPADPRLAKGGRLAYINVDFHKPKSRLRDTPYMLKPYPYDPKTSVGPGPPTQVIVTGFDPLSSFSTVTAFFASFGEIEESSNKMHPETGSYLGFATFRYKNSRPTKTGRAITAIEAAKRAVKNGNAQRIGLTNVKVEFDPEGVKSRRKMEQLLQEEKQQKQALAEASAKAPTGPKVKDFDKTFGPPPTAPKGPSFFAARQFPKQPSVPSAPESPGIPTQPKIQGLVEKDPVINSIGAQPYIFVAGSHVPVIPQTISHMKKRIRVFHFEDVRADPTGYYILFENSYRGQWEADKCYKAVNKTPFFTYIMNMDLHIRGNEDKKFGTPLRTSYTLKDSRLDLKREPGKRSLSPERRLEERRQREDAIRRRKEEEADIEEEKRQRAKNFDPVREAVSVLCRELKQQLLTSIKTKIAAPTLYNLLNPDNNADRRRRLNIPDPRDSKLPQLHVDEGEDLTPVGTPNARLDVFDRRSLATGRLDVTALPRIRKARTQDARKRNVGFTDPFARARPEVRKAIARPLHHRLRNFYSEDVDSEDDTENRSSARDTEEPESRPRSRMGSDDEESDEDILTMVSKSKKSKLSYLDQRDDDSMTEASFVISDSAIPLTKKRKLGLQAEINNKRQKKTDEELFGVPNDKIEREFPGLDVSGQEDVDMVDADTFDKADSETPDPELLKAPKKKPKKLIKKKTKEKLIEEHEALKQEQEAEVLKDEIFEQQTEAPHDHVPEAEQAGVEEDEAIARTQVEWGLSTDYPRPAVEDDFSIILDLDGLQNMIKDDDDLRAVQGVLKDVTAAKLEHVVTWAWKQIEIKALNRNGFRGLANTPVGIDGYYIPNPSGCARTEGYKKILHSEKSKYLPHHLKLQKAREEREARAKKDGKELAAEAAEAAKVAAEILLQKGTSRTNRVDNRRFVASLNDQKKALGGDAVALSFNQLKKRKKQVNFARSSIHNWGLYAMENIPQGDMIIEYVGEKIRQQVAEVREKRYLKQGIGSSYLFRIDDNIVIDATKKGGVARFINHSCMPNCTAKIIKVEGTRRIVIYALRDIAQHEELTYDYKFEREFDSTDRIPCLCGTPACKGFLN